MDKNSPTRSREIAAALLVEDGGRLLLQLRDDMPGILQPGRVGLFGGHREGEESLIECVMREISEEVGCHIPEDKFEYVMSLDGPDPEIQNGSVKGEFYMVRNVSLQRLMIREGKLLVLSLEEVLNMTEKLTPIAAIVLNEVITGERMRRYLGEEY